MYIFSTAFHAAYEKSKENSAYSREELKRLQEVSIGAKTSCDVSDHVTDPDKICWTLRNMDMGPLEVFTKCTATGPSVCLYRLSMHELLWMRTLQWEEASHKSNVS